MQPEPQKREAPSRFVSLHRMGLVWAFGASACASSPPAEQPIESPRPLATPDSALGGRPVHELILEILRKDDSAVPGTLVIHPLRTIYNREAIVPAMCYTRTEGRHNPCYVCHQNAIPGRPNTMNDGDLQEAYSFSDLGQTNHWRNLFEDRTAKVAAISDEEIQQWVSEDNYSELPDRLRAAGWKGYIPDLAGLPAAAEAFDHEGFAKDGSHWVAFNYKPLPSTFWPTNGATDDVMIRLPEPFRTTATGAYSRDVYKANLALLEANIKGLRSVTVRRLDEKAVGEDLDGDGVLGVIDRITHVAGYVGAAKGYFSLPHVYPLDTEFLHSVRYIGVDARGRIHVPPRMKELRYMKKRFMLTGPQIYEAYLQEGYDKDAGYLPGYIDRGPHGLDNEMGWVISGFIENKNGRLRTNTFEENLFCMGCHTSVGSTIDNVFSFARKVDGAEGWGYIDLVGMPDAPNRGETRGEIATYFERAGGGGEFRSNPEMERRWFTNGVLNRRKVRAAKDVYELVAPSRERALTLNKAYRVIVAEQTFIYGRDPTVTAPVNVYDFVDNTKSPTLPANRIFKWDIRLDWARSTSKPPPALGMK